MATRLNLFCNSQVAASRRYLDNFDLIKWCPNGVTRDALGLPITEEDPDPLEEVGKDADLQK